MISHESEKKSVSIQGEGIRDVSKKILAGPKNGFPGFLREFTLSPDGHTHYHRHDWYHVAYILQGTGILTYEDEEFPLRKGSVSFIEGNKMHKFANTGAEELKFLCLVTGNGDSYSEGE